MHKFHKLGIHTVVRILHNRQKHAHTHTHKRSQTLTLTHRNTLSCMMAHPVRYIDIVGRINWAL